MKARKLAVAVGVALMLGSTATFATGGLAGSAHDFSSAFDPATGKGGTKLLVWLSGATQTTYNTGTPYCTSGSVATSDCKQGTSTVQIGLCTKCHTPHKAKIQSLLWNHTLNSVQYQWDDTVTTAGTTYAKFKGDTYKGPTTKCLSCHDGLLASTDGMWFNRQSVSGSKYVAPPGALDSGHEVADGTTGKMTGTHPVAMPYPYLQAANKYNSVTSGLATALTEFVGDPTGKNIMLYNDDGAGNISRGPAAAQTGMECGSCHDVHNGPRATGPMLVTGNIVGSDASYICNKCHIK